MAQSKYFYRQLFTNRTANTQHTHSTMERISESIPKAKLLQKV